MKVLKSRKSYSSRVHQNEEFEKYLYCEEKFNMEGMLIELIEFNQEGNIEMHEKREYIDKDLSKIHTLNMNFNTEQITEFVYLLGLLVEETEYYSKESFIRSKIFYDSEERIVRIEKRDENDAFRGEENFEYFSSQVIKKEIDETRKILNQNVIILNSNGEISETAYTEYFYKKEQLDYEDTSITRYKYQDANVVKEEVESNGKVFYTKNEVYDSQSNLVEYQIEDHQVDYIVKGNYKYNSLNLETCQVEFFDSKQVFREDKKYDNANSINEIVQKNLEQDGYVSIYKQNFENEYW